MPSDVKNITEIKTEEQKEEPKAPKKSDTEAQTSMFACHLCGKEYANPRALGGHVSKFHKGQSETYNYKMKIRKEREKIREALSLAKLFIQKFSLHPKKIDRVRYT